MSVGLPSPEFGPAVNGAVIGYLVSVARLRHGDLAARLRGAAADGSQPPCAPHLSRAVRAAGSVRHLINRVGFSPVLFCRLPRGLRVAFVVTRSPSEPWQIARSTLSAMLTQRFPREYDVWLCDEQPGAEVMRWCQRNHVKVSTRHGVRDYHRLGWPRRTRCKEGNLAYFYDHWGYWHYDVAVQLDCDHLPAPTYLAEMVRPFADPAVGYVAAPSVCDANGAASWSARPIACAWIHLACAAPDGLSPSALHAPGSPISMTGASHLRS